MKINLRRRSPSALAMAAMFLGASFIGMSAAPKAKTTTKHNAKVAATAETTKAPKYIFYFIGDGMGISSVTNANIYNQDVRNAGPLLMTTFPVFSAATSHSANSGVTDSAAAGTALATAHKTKNNMLGMGPDTVAVNSIAKYLHDAGYGVGIITTVAIDDATPGAFYTHVPNRSHFYDTGRYLADSDYEFFAGAALRGTKDKNGTPNDLVPYIESKGVNIAYGLDGLDSSKRRQLLLSPFHETRNNNCGYTIDSIPGALTLPAMTEAAIKHLQQVAPDRFFMMVEGGNIDHAAHANDGASEVIEIINFNDAIKHAYDFMLAHPDETLIVVTADHETGGMSVACAATGYSTPVGNASAQRVSKEMFNQYCREILDSDKPYTWEDMKKYLEDNFGLWKNVKMNPDETESLERMFNDIFEKRSTAADTKTLYASFNGFANRVIDIVNYKSGFGWTTPHHTGAPVPVFVAGVGAENFGNFMDNTDIPRNIMKIVGLEFE